MPAPKHPGKLIKDVDGRGRPFCQFVTAGRRLLELLDLSTEDSQNISGRVAGLQLRLLLYSCCGVLHESAKGGLKLDYWKNLKRKQWEASETWHQYDTGSTVRVRGGRRVTTIVCRDVWQIQ